MAGKKKNKEKTKERRGSHGHRVERSTQRREGPFEAQGKQAPPLQGRGAGARSVGRKESSGKQGAGGARPAEKPGEWFEKLVAVQARLRAPDGCPWDREQTHASLRTYLIEEAYEVLEAMEGGDDEKFAEEMGDLLLQILFHSQIAAEEGRFTVADVIREVHDKMVRRHPHVFGEKRAKDSAEVLKNWEQLKKEERAAKGGEGKKQESLMDGVSKALPAALEGFQLTRRAARIGFDWGNVDGVFEKLKEEARELQLELGDEKSKSGKHRDTEGTEKDGGRSARVEEEMGDLLFAAVNIARWLEIDPEIALKKANAKFAARFRAMEAKAAESGKKLADVPREEMEGMWDQAKSEEKSGKNAGA
jgi:tetrapyrrole methylase family protein / MazG family protein